MAKKELKDVDFEIIWEDQPAGLWQRFLSKIHLNFTYYQITKDELIIKTGFFKQETNTIELYLLKDPDMTISLYQRILGIGTIEVTVDTHSETTEGKDERGNIYPSRKIIVMEKGKESLRDCLLKNLVDMKNRLIMINQIANGLYHIHSQGFIHRDMKVLIMI